MANEQKVALVGEAWEEYGLIRAVASVDLPKSVWYYHRNHKVSYEDEYVYLLPDLEAVARQHPEYGWTRITVELREVYGDHMNQSRAAAAQSVGFASCA